MGLVIDIDGLDGCGKATQTEVLINRLKDSGYKVYTRDFPNYTSPSSLMVREFLSGTFCKDSSQLAPELASAFYAIDRSLTVIDEGIGDKVKTDTILVFDRYITSNWIYHGVKIPDISKRMEFFDWEYDLEVNRLNIPPIDISILLTLPVMTSQSLISSRYNGDDTKKDIIESDIEYLEAVRNNLGIVKESLGKKCKRCELIECADSNGDILSIKDISDKIYQVIQPYLKLNQ